MRFVGNPLEIVASRVLKSLKIFLHFQLLPEVVRISSEVVGNLRRSLEVLWNLRQFSQAVGKSSEIQILWKWKISRTLLKKFGRYNMNLSCAYIYCKDFEWVVVVLFRKYCVIKNLQVCRFGSVLVDYCEFTANERIWIFDIFICSLFPL